MKFFSKRQPASSGDSELKSEKRKNRWKRLKVQLLVFFLFFILVEFILQAFLGYKPGVASNVYYQPGDAIYDSVLYADAEGITHHLPTGNFYPEQMVNAQGFMGYYDYTPEVMDSLRNEGKKIVMLVGDSFVAGCCPDTYNDAFANLLNASDEYAVLNFGVGGTDPLHYELVVKKYLPLLKPDLVSVVVYLGNDEMPYDRTPKPYVPVCYPVKDGFWFSSEAYIHLAEPNTYFKNFEEAKKFYFKYYSLRSDQSNWFEKVIRNSVILSRIYLYAKVKYGSWSLGELYEPGETPPFTYNHLSELMAFCDEQSTPVHFTAIASANDVITQAEVKAEHSYFFEEIEWDYPKNIVPEDYDGTSDGSHYNTSGHKKFAKFLDKMITKELSD